MLLTNKVKNSMHTPLISRQDTEVRISDNESSDSDSEDNLAVANYSNAESSEGQTNEEYLVPVVPCFLAKLALDLILGHNQERLAFLFYLKPLFKNSHTPARISTAASKNRHSKNNKKHHRKLSRLLSF